MLGVKAARERGRAPTGKCRGRKSEGDPEAAKKLARYTDERAQQIVAPIAAELKAAGHAAKRG